MNPATYLRECIDLVRSIETRFLELGARLYRIREKELWKDRYDSYQEFLDTAKVSPGNASILASIHRHYVVEGRITKEKLAGVGYSNLYESIPLIERSGVNKALEIARTLTRAEIKQEVRDEKHPDCTHDQTLVICAKCKKRI
jgi:hypothetical protein